MYDVIVTMLKYHFNVNIFFFFIFIILVNNFKGRQRKIFVLINSTPNVLNFVYRKLL